MALKFPKLPKFEFFGKLGARSRIAVLAGGVVGVLLLVYISTKLLTGGEETTGPTRVASAPSGLQSVPGGQLLPEYQKALEQANVQRAEQAELTGTAAVPTLINIGQQGTPGNECNIICSDEAANVKYSLGDWVKQGKVLLEVSDQLQKMADANVPESEYANLLDQLVQQGKLTPEQARELLDRYKKQHANALLQDSAKAMDAMIKSGQLSIDGANELLLLQKNKASPAEYANKLDDMVKKGKISPQVAQQLLAQYTQQRLDEVTKISIATLRQMAKTGQMTPDVEKTLIDLENKHVSVTDYSTTLSQLVTAGKLTPIVSKKVLEEYLWQKSMVGPSSSLDELIKKAEKAAFEEINDLLTTGKISPDTANQLRDMINRNIPFKDFQDAIAVLVQQQKLTPDIAKLKIADYQLVKGLRDMAQRLSALQGSNGSSTAYLDELKRAVQAGLLTPEEAARLMREYQALSGAGQPTGVVAGGGTEEFAKLQQSVQQGGGISAPVVSDQFSQAQTEAEAETAEAQRQRLETLMAAMSSQAGQLINTWQPVPMLHREGSPALAKASVSLDGGRGRGGSRAPKETIIKAGTILFGVLDTGVNSDYPDTPVMVTIVDGKYKHAKLLGKLAVAKNVVGQMDKVTLSFNLMNMDAWTSSRTVSAFAIDPDTARTALASNVNYHYFLRYGAIMATSFLQGYASAITTSGSTTTTGIFGTSTVHPELSPGQKLATALGQVGTTLGSTVQNYANIPPTVKVDSGVGLGILFMSDVTV